MINSLYCFSQRILLIAVFMITSESVRAIENSLSINWASGMACQDVHEFYIRRMEALYLITDGEIEGQIPHWKVMSFDQKSSEKLLSRLSSVIEKSMFFETKRLAERAGYTCSGFQWSIAYDLDGNRMSHSSICSPKEIVDELTNVISDFSGLDYKPRKECDKQPVKRK